MVSLKILISFLLLVYIQKMKPTASWIAHWFLYLAEIKLRKYVFKKFESDDGLRLSIEIRIGKFLVRLIALFQSYYQENFMIWTQIWIH